MGSCLSTNTKSQYPPIHVKNISYTTSENDPSEYIYHGKKYTHNPLYIRK